MGARGAFGDHQPFGDLAVGQPLCLQLGDLPLAWRQLAGGGPRRLPGSGPLVRHRDVRVGADRLRDLGPRHPGAQGTAVVELLVAQGLLYRLPHPVPFLQQFGQHGHRVPGQPARALGVAQRPGGAHMASAVGGVPGQTRTAQGRDQYLADLGDRLQRLVQRCRGLLAAPGQPQDQALHRQRGRVDLALSRVPQMGETGLPQARSGQSSRARARPLSSQYRPSESVPVPARRVPAVRPATGRAPPGPRWRRRSAAPRARPRSRSGSPGTGRPGRRRSARPRTARRGPRST